MPSFKRGLTEMQPMLSLAESFSSISCWLLAKVTASPAGWLSSILTRLGLSDYSGTIQISLLLLIGAGGLAGSFWLFRDWLARREQKAISDPWFLFREICTAHQLQRSAIRLLRRLVSASEVSQPAELFLNREVFDKTASRPEFIPHRPQLKLLGKQLYGELVK